MCSGGIGRDTDTCVAVESGGTQTCAWMLTGLRPEHQPRAPGLCSLLPCPAAMRAQWAQWTFASAGLFCYSVLVALPQHGCRMVPPTGYRYDHDFS